MTKKQIKQREIASTMSSGMCAICGKPLINRQYAHKIANTKTNRKKYGTFIIDHWKNGDYVCSLVCNDKMNIGMNKGKCLKLIADIIIYEINKFQGRG